MKNKTEGTRGIEKQLARRGWPARATSCIITRTELPNARFSTPYRALITTMGFDAVFAHSIVQVIKIGEVDPKKIYRKCLRFGRIYKRAEFVTRPLCSKYY
ncbi:hypothetical protein AX14_014132 [Amanita brunnescens Koide BX004]|nr:hypothetical protein AX14_014132 [Amanita brunnescens Koide BX004]